MSRYEWERGTITIPSAQWAKFKAEVREGYNKSKLSDFQTAGTLQAKLLSLHAIHKSKNPNTYGGYWDNLLKLAWEAVEKPVHNRYGVRTDSEISYGQRDDIEQAIFRNGTKNVPLKPLKKSFPLADSTTKSLSLGDANVEFEDKTRGATWDVSENNRAIEHANATALAKAFFSALSKIEWTRGSGGKIIGNDEYNRDNEYEGGGGNTVNHEFGPESQKRQRAFDAANKPRYTSYYNTILPHR